MRQVYAEKLCPKGERKVKVQGAADQVKDFSMQLDLIDKHKGEKEVDGVYYHQHLLYAI